MCQQVPAIRMSQDGGEGPAVVCEDKATSTDEELLASPEPMDGHDDAFGPDNYFRYMAQAAQLWGADLVGLERCPERSRYLRHQESPEPPYSGRYLRHQESPEPPYSGRYLRHQESPEPPYSGRYLRHQESPEPPYSGRYLRHQESPEPPYSGRYLRHQESLSSNSDVSRPRRQAKFRRQRTTDSDEADHQTRLKSRPLRRQWTTESSDSGYCKRSSRDLLRRQDTDESADSTKRLIRDLQRQPTTESSSSLRLTRQSSIRSASDNQSLYLLRQSTVETYDDDVSTTDFSRPQSCSSSRHASTGGPARDTSPPTYHPHRPQLVYGGSVGAVVRTPGAAAPLLSAASCSLINLSAVDLEAAQIQQLHKSLRALGPEARRKRPGVGGHEERLVMVGREEEEEMPRKVRWSIMATGLILLLMSLILVGATLKMAPLIDEMVRKENEEILRELEEASSGASLANSTVPEPGRT